MNFEKAKIGILVVAFLMIATVPALAQERSPIDETADTSERPYVEVQLEIADILARMNFAIDREDYDEYLTFFAKDFVFDSGFGEPMTDEASVRAFLEENQASGFIVGKRHVMSNLMMVQSGNRVFAQYYLSVFEREQTPAVVATAFIVDEFEQQDGEWRVVRHVTTVDPAIFNTLDTGN